jgi:hypothetical protein
MAGHIEAGFGTVNPADGFLDLPAMHLLLFGRRMAYLKTDSPPLRRANSANLVR